MVGAKLQADPAEGSREVIERELRRLDHDDSVRASACVDAADVATLLGDLDAASTARILALTPSLTDLELAAAWLAGNGDQPAQAGHPLAGKAAAIFDIAASVEDNDVH